MSVATPYSAWLGEEDYLTMLIMEGEGYIAAAHSKTVLAAMRTAAEQGRPASYGALAVELGHAVGADARYAAHMIRQLRIRPGAPKPIGYFILERGLARPTQLLEALEEQVQMGGRLGEILIKNGCLTESQLEAVLALQKAA